MTWIFNFLCLLATQNIFNIGDLLSLSLSPNFGELSLIGDYVVKWSCSAFDRVNYVIFFPKKIILKLYAIDSIYFMC